MDIRIKFTDQPLGFNNEDNCYIHALKKKYHVIFSDDPQIVFYSCFGTDFLAYPNSVKVFLANEPVLPNFNDCDYAIGAIDLSFGDRYFRQPPITNYGEQPYWEDLDSICYLPEHAAQRKFCNFIYTNKCNGRGAELRIQFCRMLTRYRSVDCPGNVLNNMNIDLFKRYRNGKLRCEDDFNQKWAEDKLAFLKGYKFTIAFENTALPGFTTEKLIHPLLAQSVPIYWGNPQVTEYFNSKAFINCADYGDDIERVMQRVIELDQDDDQYMEMLSQPPLRESFPRDWEDALADFLVAIVDKGCVPLDKNPIGFANVSAQDLGMLCRQGKIGLRYVLQATTKELNGWLYYKTHRKQGGELK